MPKPGIVQTDSAISKAVKIAYKVATSEGPKISYPVPVVKETKNPEASRKFLDYEIDRTQNNIPAAP
jgi:ABC-type molybdate transport system substrate-binding protein